MNTLVMKVLLILTLSTFTLSSLAGIDKCLLADKVSREFTLAAVKKDMKKAKKFMNPQIKLGKDSKFFKERIQRQFKSLLGKEVFHSVSTKGLERADCHLNKKGIRIFKDHRLLLHFDPKSPNATAQILPMAVEVRLIKGKGWLVHNFSSTAF